MVATRGIGRTFYVIVLSDFINVPDYTRELLGLTSIGHSVLGIAVRDKMEQTLPVAPRFSAFRVQDLETGEEAVIGSIHSLQYHHHRGVFQAAQCRFEAFTTEGRR